MRHFTLLRASILLLLVSAGTVAPGCGGGGGGGSTPCGLPGSLIALALEGAPAPGTGAGTFAPLPPTVQASAADGGWSAFVADVSGGTTARGLFAAEPSGAVHLVFAKGETVPLPGIGTIDDFQRVFVTSGGVLVTLATITGGNAFGILTARIDGTGAVVEKDSVVYSGDTLSTVGHPGSFGALTAIDDDQMQVDDQGTVVFVATGTGGTPPKCVFRADRDGANLLALALSGDPAAGFPFDTLGFNFEGLAIDGDGVLVAYGADVQPSGLGALFVTNGVTTTLVVADTDPVPGAGGLRTFTDVVHGVVAVNYVPPNAVVFWQSTISGGAPNQGVFFRQVAPTLGSATDLALPGQIAPGGGTFAGISLLEMQHDPGIVTIEADVTAGTTARALFSIPGPGTHNTVVYQGEQPPGAATGAFYTLSFPSLGVPHENATDNVGSPAFTAVLTDGSSGVWWALRLCGLFDVAMQGDPAPGTVGGAFTSFATPSTLDVSRDSLVFRAAIGGGTNPSGLFRQH